MIHLKYTIEFRVTVFMCLCKNNHVYEGQKHKWTVCEPFTILKEKNDNKTWDSFNIFCDWACLYINPSNN